MRTLLKELRAAGAAILLSSHQLSEVALVCDRVAFLYAGRLLRYGRLDELLGSTEEVEIALRNFTPGSSDFPNSEFTAKWGLATPSGAWRIASSETRHFLEAAWAQGAELVSVTPMRGDLTELFLQWTSSKEQWTSGEGRHP